MIKLELVGKRLELARKNLVSMMPEFIEKDFDEESYIAGGAVYSLYNDEDPKDYDVFIRSLDLKMKLLTYFKEVNGLKVNYFNGKLIRLGEYLGYKLVITDNAITIGQYQIILKDIGEPKDVVGKFDFLHNMHYVESGKVYSVEDLYYLDLKELIFNDTRARDIVSTIVRTTKFIERGFTLSSKELSKMLLKLHESGFTEDEIMLLKESPNYTSFGSGI